MSPVDSCVNATAIVRPMHRLGFKRSIKINRVNTFFRGRIKHGKCIFTFTIKQDIRQFYRKYYYLTVVFVPSIIHIITYRRIFIKTTTSPAVITDVSTRVLLLLLFVRKRRGGISKQSELNIIIL